MLLGPLHYLPLLELNLGALDQAAPLAGWELPEAFQTLRCLLEARAGRAGRREYVQVFRLLETFELHEVHAPLDHALALGAIGFDAVKHLVCGGWQSAQPIACVRLHPVDLGVRALALEPDRPPRAWYAPCASLRPQRPGRQRSRSRAPGRVQASTVALAFARERNTRRDRRLRGGAPRT